MNDACRLSTIDGIEFLVDREDLEKVQGMRWWSSRKDTAVRIVTNIYRPGGQRTKITLARFLINCPADKSVCFVNPENRFDFRKSNLLICDFRQKKLKCGKTRRPTSSKYRGVTWVKDRKKWRSFIQVNGKTISLGYYEVEKTAAEAYDEAALKYFGEIAVRNFK